MDINVKPFLKWAGGKRQLIKIIDNFRINLHGEVFGSYYEPFAGAAAYFFHLKPSQATINDLNEEIINTYDIIKRFYKDLITELMFHEEMDLKLGSEHYYEVRSWDRIENFKSKYSDIQRAARIIYLNKKCYNGLYRVNSKGYFNVPYDSSKRPFKADIENIKNISSYLKSNDILITNTDYENSVVNAKEGDLIYFDPPYYPVNETSNFDSYTANGFGKTINDKQEEQKRLKRLADILSQKGCIVLISNSNTDFIKQLYDNNIDGASSDVQYYRIEPVTARRMINSVYTKRTSEKSNELLITNIRR